MTLPLYLVSHNLYSFDQSTYHEPLCAHVFCIMIKMCAVICMKDLVTCPELILFPETLGPEPCDHVWQRHQNISYNLEMNMGQVYMHCSLLVQNYSNQLRKFCKLYGKFIWIIQEKTSKMKVAHIQTNTDLWS